MLELEPKPKNTTCEQTITCLKQISDLTQRLQLIHSEIEERAIEKRLLIKKQKNDCKCK